MENRRAFRVKVSISGKKLVIWGHCQRTSMNKIFIFYLKNNWETRARSRCISSNKVCYWFKIMLSTEQPACQAWALWFTDLPPKPLYLDVKVNEFRVWSNKVSKWWFYRNVFIKSRWSLTTHTLSRELFQTKKRNLLLHITENVLLYIGFGIRNHFYKLVPQGT